MSTFVEIRPPHGWQDFARSGAIIALLWANLEIGPHEIHWHYLNMTSDTSIWEHGAFGRPEPFHIYIAIDAATEEIMEFHVELPRIDCVITREFMAWFENMCNLHDLEMRGEGGERFDSLAALLLPDDTIS